MRRSAPLRFLAMVLGGWAALRTVVVAPPWSEPLPEAAAAARMRPSPSPFAAAVVGEPRTARPEPGAERRGPKAAARARALSPSAFTVRPNVGPEPALPAALHSSGILWAAEPERSAAPPPPSPGFAAIPGAAASRTRAGRWSLSAWSFVRRGRAQPLAGAGLLGGSQAGARLAYRLNGDPARALSLAARLSAPLRRPAGSEAALGIDWRPSRRIPVHLLAERRQALGREGRSAFGLTVYGGVSDVAAGRFRIDAYAQAGLVGARSRDAFADGSIRLSLPLGAGVRIGAGAWAAAQPGVSRVDLGPQAAVRTTLAGRPVTLAADWRLRVAGDAEPGSGPTVTLATDF